MFLYIEQETKFADLSGYFVVYKKFWLFIRSMFIQLQEALFRVNYFIDCIMHF